MPFRLKLTLIVFGLLALSVAVLPLILPIPELDTVPARQLAGDEGAFVTVDGLEVFYEEAGSGGTPLLLLHGFGASTFSWREVLAPLGAERRTVAFDRPAFGLTERPAVPPGATGLENPYTPEAQVALTVGLLDALGLERAVLVGNSSGGTLALQVALAHPERVAGLVLVGAAVYEGGGAPAWVRPLLHTPQMNRLGPLIMRQFGEGPGLEFLRRSYADPECVTEEVIAGYRRPLRADGWDVALWELTKASRTPDLAPRLGEVRVPTLVVSGAADAIVPPEQSQRLAQEIPGAELALLEGCGHLPQEECPEAFVAAVTAWLEGGSQ